MEAFIIVLTVVIAVLVLAGRWAKKTFGCCCHEWGPTPHYSLLPKD